MIRSDIDTDASEGRLQTERSQLLNDQQVQ